MQITPTFGGTANQGAPAQKFAGWHYLSQPLTGSQQEELSQIRRKGCNPPAYADIETDPTEAAGSISGILNASEALKKIRKWGAEQMVRFQPKALIRTADLLENDVEDWLRDNEIASTFIPTPHPSHPDQWFERLMNLKSELWKFPVEERIRITSDGKYYCTLTGEPATLEVGRLSPGKRLSSGYKTEPILRWALVDTRFRSDKRHLMSEEFTGAMDDQLIQMVSLALATGNTLPAKKSFLGGRLSPISP